MPEVPDDAHRITDVAALEALYGTVEQTSLRDEVDQVHPRYRKLIAAAPADAQLDRRTLPSTGTWLAALTNTTADADTCDRALPARVQSVVC